MADEQNSHASESDFLVGDLRGTLSLLLCLRAPHAVVSSARTPRIAVAMDCGRIRQPARLLRAVVFELCAIAANLQALQLVGEAQRSLLKTRVQKCTTMPYSHSFRRRAPQLVASDVSRT